MQQRTGKIMMSVRAPAIAPRRLACVAALLVAASLAEDSLAGVALRVSTSHPWPPVHEGGVATPSCQEATVLPRLNPLAKHADGLSTCHSVLIPFFFSGNVLNEVEHTSVVANL